MSRVCSTQRRPAKGPVLDDLPDELDAEPAAAVLVEDVDVGEIHEAGRVAVHRAREADLPPSW